MLKILSVVGARPNFMKIAPLMSAFAGRPGDFEPLLVHTGQHYDENMSRVFFDELGIPRPDINLEVGSGSHGAQTGAVMIEFEKVCMNIKPDLVLVVGDVNSTAACSLTAAKANIPVAHVEAGLRSFDRSMPEEINRIVADAVSNYLFVTEKAGVENLLREGKSEENVFLVGNVMVDTLMRFLPMAKERDAAARLGLPTDYAIVTLHRPSNVDDPAAFRGIVGALAEIAGRIPVLFPVHPRTKERIGKMVGSGGLPVSPKDTDAGCGDPGLYLMPPASYLDFLSLMQGAAIVLTDSGGIQEETTALGVPCLTLRENTERPSTIECGTNRLIGTNPERIVAEANDILNGGATEAGMPPLWDGHAAERIAEILIQRVGK